MGGSRKVRSAGVIVAMLLVGILWATPVCSQVTFLPAEKIFPLCTADALSHQFSLSRVTDNQDWIGVAGASIPLAELQQQGFRLQASIAASMFNRLLKTPGHIRVNTVDYKVDIPFDLRLDAYAFRFGYGHISSHYADNGILVLGNTARSYIKDYLMAGASRDIGAAFGEIYLAVTYNYHSVPVEGKPLVVQLGGTFLRIPLTTWLESYCAVDWKLKQEVAWSATQSYQIGGRLFRRGDTAVRVFYTFRTGSEERGQLWDERATANLVGVAIDF